MMTSTEAPGASSMALPSEYVNETDLTRDPYPIFDRLRREAPVYWYDTVGAHLVTRWEECERILLDPGLFAGLEGGPGRARGDRVFGTPTILGSNGELHRGLRRSVDGPLRPRAVRDHVEALIRPVVKERLRQIIDRGSADLVAEYFEPISVRCLGDLLGLQEIDDDTLRGWFSGMVSGLTNPSLEEVGFARSDAVRSEIESVVAPMIERLRMAPDSTALSHMVHGGRDAGDPRSLDEVLPTLAVYITGGMQEPGHGCASAMLGLLGEPAQLARVSADPSLVPRAVEEGLRWLSPIAHTERQATEPTELAGVPLKPGVAVYLMLSAANRDPDRFAEPDRFDIDRENHRHFAFGGGLHVCAGNAFGRAIMRVALEELLAAAPGIRLDPEAEVLITGWHFRSPRRLPVLLDGGGGA